MRIVDGVMLDEVDAGHFAHPEEAAGKSERAAHLDAAFESDGRAALEITRIEEAADAELKQLLAAVRRENAAAPCGSLLFTCNGRGTRMFSQPHHDAAAVAAAFGPIPLSGFFDQGELGPIGQQNFVHGFTASIGLFYSEE